MNGFSVIGALAPWCPENVAGTSQRTLPGSWGLRGSAGTDGRRRPAESLRLPTLGPALHPTVEVTRRALCCFYKVPSCGVERAGVLIRKAACLDGPHAEDTPPAEPALDAARSPPARAVPAPWCLLPLEEVRRQGRRSLRGDLALCGLIAAGRDVRSREQSSSARTGL